MTPEAPPFRLAVDPPDTVPDEPPEPDRGAAVVPVFEPEDEGVRRSAPLRSGGGGGELSRDSTRDPPPEPPDELEPDELEPDEPEPDEPEPELDPDELPDDVSVRGTAWPDDVEPEPPERCFPNAKVGAARANAATRLSTTRGD